MNGYEARVGQKLIKHRHCQIGGQYIGGWWYEDEDGERVWKISWAGETVGEFCVSGTEFRFCGSLIPRSGPADLINIIREVVNDLDPAIRHTILEKIRIWESEETGAAGQLTTSI
jgi:hypothetical protein